MFVATIRARMNVKAHIAVISHTVLVRGCLFHTEREGEREREKKLEKFTRKMFH